jgi:two-component system cell cycle response regulator
VVHQNPQSHVELHRLQLDDARALLHHNPVTNLPSPEESATGYLQGVINGLCELSLKDPLTGLANRKHLQAIQARTLDVVVRSGEPALLLMLEIDNLRSLIEAHGASVSGQVLPAVSKSVALSLRSMDSVARFDAHTFSVVMPSCPPPYGAMVAERIRDAVQTLTIELSNALSVQVTVSVGGSFASEWAHTSPDEWTSHSLGQLQIAISQGRNQVCIDPIEEIFVSAEEKNLLFSHLGLSEPAMAEDSASDSKGVI